MSKQKRNTLPPITILVIVGLILCTGMFSLSAAAQMDKTKKAIKNKAINLNNIPDGVFLDQLKKLDKAKQIKVLKDLNDLKVPLIDLSSMRIGQTGKFYYVEPAIPKIKDILKKDGQHSTGQSTDQPTTSQSGSINQSNIFTLHSRPGAPNVIYLDFDGHTVEGTAWNESGETYEARPLDLDGDPDTFNAAEVQWMEIYWHRMKEDFAPFNVDVTTEEPTNFNNRTARLLITYGASDANGTEMPAGNAGGVAYLDTWGSSNFQYFQPAFVYIDNCGGQGWSCAEPGAHEIGHNLGLFHDWTETDDYYPGHGSGNTAWAPIMGASYFKAVTQWDRGEFENAENQQDDIQIISSKLGVIPNDHGNNSSGATPLSINSEGRIISTTPENDPNNSNPQNKGIISTATDVDFFSFFTETGLSQISITPARVSGYVATSAGTNLDIQATLYNSAGTAIIVADKADDLDAYIEMELPRGTYHLAITGVGDADTPYSDYGSQGQYFISGVIGLRAPQITQQPESVKVNPGENVTFSVSANANPAPTYQWQKVEGSNISNISGATSNTLVINNANESDIAGYRVIVINERGDIASEVANLSLNGPPAISTQPVSQAKPIGQSATFRVQASADPAPSYQWQKSNGSSFQNIGGATSNSYTISNIQESDTGQYRVYISNPAGTAISDVVSLSIEVELEITNHPSSITKVSGERAVFTVSANGNPAPNYQWQKKNGSSFNNLSGQTTNTLSIANVSNAEEGDYRVIVSNSGKSLTSNIANLQVHSAPTITQQPISQTINSGRNATFQVAASGDPSPSYQWQSNKGSGFFDLDGQVTSVLTLRNVNKSQEGQYRVVVTNSVSAVNSSTVILTVNGAPNISSQPSSQAKRLGENVTFVVSATGDPAPTYQWQKVVNDSPINLSGENSTALSISNIKESDAGHYRVLISNAEGSVFSNIATLSVSGPPIFSTQPESISKQTGETATFSADAVGNPTPSYQWMKKRGGTYIDISGATSSSFTITNISEADAGNYKVRAYNSSGRTESAIATLSVTPAGPVITSDPSSQQVNPGEDAEFNVEVSSSSVVSYQWEKRENGSSIIMSGATTPTFVIPNVSFEDQGVYRVKVTNSHGTVYSRDASLTVNTSAPIIVKQPESAVVGSGSNATFTVQASGSPEPVYQWQHNRNGSFVNISGAQSDRFTISNVSKNDEGRYRVRVINSYGEVLSREVQLTVDADLPVITRQPADISARDGDDISFHIDAQGVPTPKYQWEVFHNGSYFPMSGENSKILSINNVREDDETKYRVKVYNSNGHVFSRETNLIVSPPIGEILRDPGFERLLQ